MLTVRFPPQHLSAPVTKVRLLLSIKHKQHLWSWAGTASQDHCRPLRAPVSVCKCGNWKWELARACARSKGWGALASDWVFREQRGVQKAPQWSNRISSLWWMVCESSTDSSLSQIHMAVSVCTPMHVCMCVHLHASPAGSRTFHPRAAGMRKTVTDTRTRIGHLCRCTSSIEAKDLKNVQRSRSMTTGPIQHAKQSARARSHTRTNGD